MRTNGARLLIFAAVCAIFSLVALCLVLLIRTNQNQEFKEQAAQNCRELNVVKGAIRAVLMDGQSEALEHVEPAQHAFVREYYARQLLRFADDKCPT
jgi:hypothetical protein